MSTTEAPAVTYALPTSSDGGEAVVEALALERGEQVQWHTDRECPDDLRSRLYDAISHGFQQEMGGWDLLPRAAQHEGDVVRVQMVPLLVVYDSEQEQQPQESPRQRVLTVMDEYHQEQREDFVPLEAIEARTQGSTATVHEAVERLVRDGEIYEVSDQRYCRTGWS